MVKLKIFEQLKFTELNKNISDKTCNNVLDHHLESINKNLDDLTQKQNNCTKKKSAIAIKEM